MEESEARRLQLPGSDVFVRSHLAYRDPLNNAAMVAELSHEAYRAFRSTSFVNHGQQRRQEGAATTEWFENGMEGEVPVSPYGHHYLTHFNIENLLVGTGFELSLKAKLLHEGYLVHELVRESPFRELQQLQQSSPVKAEDLLAVEGYQVQLQSDGQHRNCLRGLTAKSVNFNRLLSERQYREAVGLGEQTRAIIDFYRKLRNAIHLPGDIVAPPATLSNVDIEAAIISYINTNVVEFSNAQVELQELPSKLLLPAL